LKELGIEVINRSSMYNGRQRRVPLAAMVYTGTPGTKGIGEGPRKGGETNSVLLFSPGNIVLELCEKDENKSVFILGFGKYNFKICSLK
jgi:hypothetical protein